MQRRHLVVALVLALAAGFAAGWWVRHVREPTFEERLDEAADDIRHRAEELLK